MLNALVSSSIKRISSSMYTLPLSAQSEYSCHRSSQPALWADRFATIVPKATPIAPIAADIEPPPGAGDSDAVSSVNPFRVRSTSFFLLSSSRMYSIIFFFGSKGYSSSRPMDFTAILIISLSEIPVDLFCLCKKYLPASSIALSGTTPTNSEPVTRNPRSCAFLDASSKAMCMGVIEISVRLIEIWAMPYSSINQPMALQALRLPGIHISFPFSSKAFLPVTGLPTRCGLPFSRISKATAFALRVDVVFRLIL